MAQSQIKTASDVPAADEKFGRHNLDSMSAARLARNLVTFQPSVRELERLLTVARQTMPGLADTGTVQAVLRHNPACVMALARRSRFNPADPQGEGFIAILPLNKLGMQVLALDAFNTAHPDLRLVAGPLERPAGVYMWCVFAPGPLAAGIALFMDKMREPQYAGVDLYSRPNTDAGRHYNKVLGAAPGAKIEGIAAPQLWVFPRAPERPLYDSYAPGAAAGVLGITVARTMEDLSRVIALRSAVYIGEQECPYDEEYDGNDLAATHLLAYIGNEPAGCLRLRFFADFAKVERLAIRKEFRSSRAAFQLVRAGLKLCQKKGYVRAYGHSQARLVNFWSRFGFHVPENAKHFVFSDFDYVEMVADLERDPAAIAIGADPYTIIRPEGRWHQPGVLEKSASRAVTQPSVLAKR